MIQNNDSKIDLFTQDVIPPSEDIYSIEEIEQELNDWST